MSFKTSQEVQYFEYNFMNEKMWVPSTKLEMEKMGSHLTYTWFQEQTLRWVLTGHSVQVDPIQMVQEYSAQAAQVQVEIPGHG